MKINYQITGFNKDETNETLRYITSFIINEPSKIQEEADKLYDDYQEINYISVTKQEIIEEYDYDEPRLGITSDGNYILMDKDVNYLFTKEGEISKVCNLKDLGAYKNLDVRNSIENIGTFISFIKQHHPFIEANRLLRLFKQTDYCENHYLIDTDEGIRTVDLYEYYDFMEDLKKRQSEVTVYKLSHIINSEDNSILIPLPF